MNTHARRVYFISNPHDQMANAAQIGHEMSGGHAGMNACEISVLRGA